MGARLRHKLGQIGTLCEKSGIKKNISESEI